MNERGTYGRPRIGADVHHYHHEGSSWGKWIVGGLVVGGVFLWARHQSKQVEKLYQQSSLPYQSFGSSLREDTKELASAAGDKFRALSQRIRTKKEA